jgi:hypothetical protein
MKFPNVTGSNLLRRKLSLPADFQGGLNILLIPFQRWHQLSVDSWIPFVSQLENDIAGVFYYELPTIERMNFFSRTFINEGMRAGIPNIKARQRTITLYLDKSSFRKALDLPNEDEIYILLVDRQGEILWEESGSFTPEKGDALARLVHSICEKYGASENH